MTVNFSGRKCDTGGCGFAKLLFLQKCYQKLQLNDERWLGLRLPGYCQIRHSEANQKAWYHLREVIYFSLWFFPRTNIKCTTFLPGLREIFSKSISCMAFLYWDLTQATSALENWSLRITATRASPTFLPFNTSFEYIPSFAVICLGFLEYALILWIFKSFRFSPFWFPL